MQHLHTGQFFGQTHTTLHLPGITLTDTEYTHNKVDWHYHENAYFTFILHGNVIEGNKKEVYNCSAGTLLFHNWQEPHYNIKPEGYTRGFHIELKHTWFEDLALNKDKLQGSLNISDIDSKLLLWQIFRETKVNDDTTTLSIQTLLLKALAQLFSDSHSESHKKPSWVPRLKEILYYSTSEKLTLEYLSNTLQIHPVHLSRDFSKYFHCNLGEYLRKLKLGKSLALLSDKNKSLTEIAHECGFSDSSHFNRCFKSGLGQTPSHFRRLIF